MDRPPDPLDRRFEAFVFDWDGTAVPDRRADAAEARRLVEALCDAGAHVAVVSGTHLGNIDGQLQARPAGPGRLLLHLNRGSELFEVGPEGPTLVRRREATPGEDAALSRAADLTVERLAARGLRAEIVSERLNRRKIDLIPLPEWADPPKAVIDELLAAVERRLAGCGLGGLPEVVDLALEAAREAGLADPRVTSDAKHVEIGLTDKADSGREVLAELRALGVSAGLVLIAGDELGPLGGLAGSDSLMCIPEAARATVVSVGVEPHGVPPGVLHRPGGPATFLALLEDQLLRRARGDVPSIDDEPGWNLAFDGIDREQERGREALLTLADGVVGTSGAPLLSHPAATPGVVVAGVYDGEGAATDLLAAPQWDRLPGALDDEDAATLRRVLNLHSGLLGEWVGREPQRLAAVRAALLARPGGALLRVRSAAAPAQPLCPPGQRPVAFGRERGGQAWMVVQGSPGSVAAAARERVHADGAGFDRVAWFAAFPDGPATQGPALAALATAEAAGFDRLLAEQRAAWGRRWEEADVVVEGDPDLQLAVRVSLFQLMASVASEGEAAVGARGLTGHAYRGHVFWDSDTFVLPFLAATHPAAARAILEYRLRRLPAALELARAEGRNGARFPWESAASGVDATPSSARDQSGRTVPIRTGDAEVHIVAQVAWAASHYLDWTGDEAFAAGPARRIFVETARYWAARARHDSAGHAHIYGVVGPDEYHEPVDDNACTNVLARWNLRRAAASVVRFGEGDLLPGEKRTWLDLADALVDGYDTASGLYEQFGGFFDLEPLLISEVAPRRPIVADLLLGRERVREAQVVKQADVLMLHHLVPDEVEPGSLVPNLDYYEPRTAHGSSLSPGVHAGLFARAGRLEDAVETLRLAARVDLDDVTHTSAGGLHLATMGSVWQALAFGFMGMRPRHGALGLDPRLPPCWDAYEMRACFRGVPLRVRVDGEGVRVGAAAPVALALPDGAVTVGPGEVFLGDGG